jgi:hypothetical protein
MKTLLALIVIGFAVVFGADVATKMQPTSIPRSEYEFYAARRAAEDAARADRALAVRDALATLKADAATNKVSAAILRLFRAISDEIKSSTPNDSPTAK